MITVRKFNLLTLHYSVGNYVRVTDINGFKFKGYILDIKEDKLVVLATDGITGIYDIDTRVCQVKIIRDRSPEGIEEARYSTKEINIKLGTYSVSLFAVIISFYLGVPMIGVGIAGLTCIVGGFLEDVLLKKESLF